MKMNFDNFQMQNDFPKQLVLEEQIGLFAWSSSLFPEIWSLNCQKLYLYCNFLLIRAKNLRLFAI